MDPPQGAPGESEGNVDPSQGGLVKGTRTWIRPSAVLRRLSWSMRGGRKRKHATAYLPGAGLIVSVRSVP